jgi:hypothetical protein
VCCIKLLNFVQKWVDIRVNRTTRPSHARLGAPTSAFISRYLKHSHTFHASFLCDCVWWQNTREAANTIKRMPLKRAVAFLKNVIQHKECVPFRRYNGGVGRCAQVCSSIFCISRWLKCVIITPSILDYMLTDCNVSRRIWLKQSKILCVACQVLKD